jgi:hypothetical protein
MSSSQSVLRTGRSGFDSRQEHEISLYSTESRQILRPTQLPIQWVPGALSPEINRSWRDADHYSPHLIPRSRMVEPHLRSPTSFHGAVLNYLNTGTRLSLLILQKAGVSFILELA